MKLVTTSELSKSRREPYAMSETPPEIGEIKYVALSYAWGTTARRLVTTLQNINQQLVNITIRRLPRTIRDAIDLVSELGFSYLWIDALCIIQPSKLDSSDWERESRLMGQVSNIHQPFVPERAYLHVRR
jgi:hypothetical protein